MNITTEMLESVGCEIRFHSMIYGQCAAFDLSNNIVAVGKADNMILERGVKPRFRVKAISQRGNE